MAKNPKWQAAEDERLAAEKAYKTFMSSEAALTMREDDNEAYTTKVQELNAAIEAANRKVRTTPERI